MALGAHGLVVREGKGCSGFGAGHGLRVHGCLKMFNSYRVSIKLRRGCLRARGWGGSFAGREQSL